MSLVAFCLLCRLTFADTTGDIKAHATIDGPSLPLFSWDTVPLFWYSGDPFHEFNESILEYAATFPVVVPNGNHLRYMKPANQSAEEKLGKFLFKTRQLLLTFACNAVVQVATQLKSINQSISILFYMNTMMDWTM